MILIMTWQISAVLCGHAVDGISYGHGHARAISRVSQLHSASLARPASVCQANLLKSISVILLLRSSASVHYDESGPCPMHLPQRASSGRESIKCRVSPVVSSLATHDGIGHYGGVCKVAKRSRMYRFVGDPIGNC